MLSKFCKGIYIPKLKEQSKFKFNFNLKGQTETEHVADMVVCNRHAVVCCFIGTVVHIPNSAGQTYTASYTGHTK